MRTNETLQEAPEKKPQTQKRERSQSAQVQTTGVAWQFKVLMTVIGFCVAMLVLKVFGVF